ncbi:MAG: hypothetical protein K8S62_15020 [Candidatus Sabulitectum sp.]|nr:hypothetical protein [Candidatus Sabulitectum sp.]
MSKNIITLAGPPCSGKTTAGKILSVSLRADFIDIDQLIQHDSGHTIEWMFSHEGEKTFRAAEKRILAEVIFQTAGRTVIALGGGALLDTNTRKLIERETILFTLFALPETLAERNNGNRPLAGNSAMLKNLIRQREKHYLSLGRRINTENRTPEDVAEAIRQEVLPLLSPQDRPC